MILEVGWSQPWDSINRTSLHDDAEYWITQEDAELVILVGLQANPRIIIPNPAGPYPPHPPQIQFNMAFELWERVVNAAGNVIATQVIINQPAPPPAPQWMFHPANVRFFGFFLSTFRIPRGFSILSDQLMESYYVSVCNLETDLMVPPLRFFP